MSLISCLKQLAEADRTVNFWTKAMLGLLDLRACLQLFRAHVHLPDLIIPAIMCTVMCATPVGQDVHNHGTLQVVCTIHQPSSDITDMFDDLLLLAQGHVVYHGQWALAGNYFASQGFQ